MKLSMAITLLLGCLLTLSANAQTGGKKMYKWVDEQGNVRFSDTVPPDQVKKGREEINQQGMTVKKIDREKTPEELKADAAAAQVAAEENKKKEAQAQADRALMLSYATEADLMRARDQEIEVIEANLQTTKLGISGHEQALANMLSSAAEFERVKKPVPATVNDSIAKIRKDLEAQKKLAADREASKAKVVTDYEGKLARYRELKAKAEGAASAQ